jgi:hypothetical protein
VKQKRRHALAESLANTAAGFVVSNFAWPPICIYLLHIEWKASQGFAVVLVFTVLSIARNYAVRRAFDHIHHRGHDEKQEILNPSQRRALAEIRRRKPNR